MPLEVAGALRQQRRLILQRWQHRVAALTASMNISRIELLDHMPDFVDGLIAGLSERDPDGTSGDQAARRYAPAHGEQRLHVGFDVDEVVREYGILTDVIIEVLVEALPNLDVRQLGRLLVAVNAGAAEAVSAYARHRDAELAREQGRHRAFIAHELRTPLMNAIVAATLLERRDPAIGAAAPTPILRRSLEQLRQLIDQVLIVGRLGSGIEPERAEVDVVALVREIAETVEPEAETRDVEMTVDVPP